MYWKMVPHGKRVLKNNCEGLQTYTIPLSHICIQKNLMDSGIKYKGTQLKFYSMMDANTFNVIVLSV